MKKCESCGKEFACGMQDGKPCWCAELPALDKLPENFSDCLCPECLKTLLARESNVSDPD